MLIVYILFSGNEYRFHIDSFYANHPSKALKKKADPDATGVVLLRRHRLDTLKMSIILAMILIHFIGPVYLLWYLSRRSKTLISVAVLIIFTCTLSVVLAQFTRANRHELLASAAA